MDIFVLKTPDDNFVLGKSDEKTIIDFSKIPTINSKTISNILSYKDRIIIANPKPSDLNILKMFKIHTLVPISSSIENARQMKFINEEINKKLVSIKEENEKVLKRNQELLEKLKHPS